MCIDTITQDLINTHLRRLPYLSTIIRPCNSQTPLHLPQYINRRITPGMEEAIEASTIYGILLGVEINRQFDRQITQLENMLSIYPEYCTPQFGNRLIGSFFSSYSELEVFDALVSSGYVPVRDPPIVPCLHPKKADFKINLSGVDVYIELITPFLPLDIEETIQSEPVGFYDPNVGIGTNAGSYHPLEWKLIQEYEHHFRTCEPMFNTSTILIVDTTLVHCNTPGLFRTPNFQSLFSRYHFTEYIIGILEYRTVYHRDSTDRFSTFHENPCYSGIHAILPSLSIIMETRH